jgi:hypothetical protein
MDLLKSWVTLDGIHNKAIYMLLFPSSYLQMEPTEKAGRSKWNLLKSWATLDGIHTAAIYMLLLPLAYLPMETGHPG